MTPKTFIVDYHLYPFDVMVSTDTLENVIREIERSGYKLDDEEKRHLEMDGRGRCVMLKGSATVIRLKHAPDSPANIASLSHEIFHAVVFLFDQIGIKLCNKSDEAFAYAIEYMTREILLRFRSAKPKPKRKPKRK